MSSPACACQAINAAFGACIGEFRECEIRCSGVAKVGINRGVRQSTCWEKATAMTQEETPCV